MSRLDQATDPAGALQARIDYYRPQMAAYATAVAAATGEPVTRCVLLFLSPYGAQERHVDDLTNASSQVRHVVRSA